VDGPVRLVEPAHNVELRLDHHGHRCVVFAFPYRADMVDAVRAIPGRRFDWEAKEWWAPQADATAPYVKGVLERFAQLRAAPEVTDWLAEAITGWVGRVGAAKLAGRGAFVLETIAGELPEELAAVAEERGGAGHAVARRERRGAALHPRRELGPGDRAGVPGAPRG
jgi:SWI/SNF-related matrix-associated actin-dependent regulator of chromatin subfamily A-like protein 1